VKETQVKTDIRSLSREEILSWVEEIGEKKFRANQIYEWLWQKGARSFDEMTNLSKAFREKLQDHFDFPIATIDVQQKSFDGTVKLGFKLSDGNIVEGVLIPAEDRFTACVSSQVGCSLSCAFCATGMLKRMRNLTPGEIYDQVLMLNEISLEHNDRPLSNIVFMGMGEPLLNYKNVLKGIHLITSPEGLGMSPKRITLSTAGIAKMIMKLADDGVKFNLALSLHAAEDTKRNEIMAINEQNNIATLQEALIYFKEKNERAKVTLEYILFNDFNDSIQDAHQLARFANATNTKVNIIEYNQVDGVTLNGVKKKDLDIFVQALIAHEVPVTVRRSRGKDIDAACGQLANKN